MTHDIALDDRLETAAFTWSLKEDGLENDAILLVPRLSPARAGQTTLALLDSVAALTMLRTHVIVRDIAVVWRHASTVTLTTHTRPDDVQAVEVSIHEVSPAGRALATAVITPFYGIEVAGWSEEAHAIDSAHASVTEGAAALVAAEDDEIYQEDLGRAWFLLSESQYVSHVAVAPRGLLATNPRAIADAVRRLAAAREMGATRGRELRRDLSREFNIDRETLIDTFAEQTHVLDDEAANGLAELARRSGLGVPPGELRSAVVTISRSES